VTVEEAVALQERLRHQVSTETDADLEVRAVAGLDVGYAEDSDRLAAAAVVLDAATLEPLDEAVVLGEATFPYVPGLFAFREMPSLLVALERLTVRPDLLVCDGHGLAHPRRFGLACHIGVETGLPSIGVAKNAMGAFTAPAARRGAGSDVTMDGEVVGRALRTQAGVKPVFVSVGHRIDLDRACAEVLRLSPRYRLPETTRRADAVCRAALRGSGGVAAAL
jgi:deoxyribonuclease V